MMEANMSKEGHRRNGGQAQEPAGSWAKGLLVVFLTLDVALVITATALTFSFAELSAVRINCISNLWDAVWVVSSFAIGLLVGCISEVQRNH
jgi:hypothetical protein